MTDEPPTDLPAGPITDAALDALLRARPGFLAGRPELYAVLQPPRRVHGERLADHMAAMLAAAREAVRLAEQRTEAVLAAGRAATSLAERVQGAVLALLAAADPLDCVAAELPALLGVDAASLCIEPRRRGPAGDLAGQRGTVGGLAGQRADIRTLPPGAVAALLGGRDVVLRDQPADAGLLHAEAAMLATRDALIRVPCPPGALLAGAPGALLADAPGVLLALVSRDERALAPSQGVGSLAFLGRVLALLLTRPATPT